MSIIFIFERKILIPSDLFLKKFEPLVYNLSTVLSLTDQNFLKFLHKFTYFLFLLVFFGYRRILRIFNNYTVRVESSSHRFGEE